MEMDSRQAVNLLSLWAHKVRFLDLSMTFTRHFVTPAGGESPALWAISTIRLVYQIVDLVVTGSSPVSLDE